MGFFRKTHTGHLDLRKTPRHEIHYLAQVIVNGSETPHNCIICDISGGGAKLTVGLAHENELPDEFTLVFRRHCRVVRRLDGQLAVQFT